MKEGLYQNLIPGTERETEMERIFVLLIGMMFLASCATTAPQKSVFLGEYYKKLQPVGEGGETKSWIKPGADFTKYKKVMVDYVIFSFADESEYKGIDADEMKKLADVASLALVNALKENFPVVAEPGPDVIRIRFAITDLKQSSPALSGVSSVIPVGAFISLVKEGTTGSWTGSGATAAEVMVLDSMTHEVLAAAEDKKVAGYTERSSKWGSAEEAFQFWGETITNRLLYLTKKK